MNVLVWLHAEQVYQRHVAMLKQALATPEVRDRLVERMAQRLSGNGGVPIKP